MTLIPPPGYTTREKAERILTSFQTGSLALVDRLGLRLHALVPELMGKDEATIAALVRVETDRASAELIQLAKTLTEPMEH